MVVSLFSGAIRACQTLFVSKLCTFFRVFVLHMFWVTVTCLPHRRKKVCTQYLPLSAPCDNHSQNTPHCREKNPWVCMGDEPEELQLVLTNYCTDGSRFVRIGFIRIPALFKVIYKLISYLDNANLPS